MHTSSFVIGGAERNARKIERQLVFDPMPCYLSLKSVIWNIGFVVIVAVSVRDYRNILVMRGRLSYLSLVQNIRNVNTYLTLIKVMTSTYGNERESMHPY
jgi:hypothetical protein